MYNGVTTYTVDHLEEAMQKVMDEYAGGISSNYAYSGVKLSIAKDHIKEIQELTNKLQVNNLYELMKLYELIDRLLVASVVIAHLEARKETRWHSFQENSDYPNQNDEDYFLYINSVMKDGKIQIIKRDFVDRGHIYEHSN